MTMNEQHRMNYGERATTRSGGLEGVHQTLQERIAFQTLNEFFLRNALIVVDVQILHDRIGALLVRVLVRFVFAHAEQLKHGTKNEQHLSSIDRRTVVHIVDVEGIAKLLFQRCFSRGDVRNEKLNKGDAQSDPSHRCG